MAVVGLSIAAIGVLLAVHLWVRVEFTAPEIAPPEPEPKTYHV